MTTEKLMRYLNIRLTSLEAQVENLRAALRLQNDALRTITRRGDWVEDELEQRRRKRGTQ